MQNLTLPAYANVLAADERLGVIAVIETAIQAADPLCVLWGGSTADGDALKKWADIDLWCVVDDAQGAKLAYLLRATRIANARLVHDSGYHPWLGELVTVLFFEACAFGVDIGFCSSSMLDRVTVGSAPFVVWGKLPAEMRLRLRDHLYELPPAYRLGRILVNLTKTRKALDRGFLWNAIEYISQARRDVIGLLRRQGVSKARYYSRPDHDAELMLSEKDLERIRPLAPSYSSIAIASAALLIIDISTDALSSLPDCADVISSLHAIRTWFSEHLAANSKSLEAS